MCGHALRRGRDRIAQQVIVLQVAPSRMFDRLVSVCFASMARRTPNGTSLGATCAPSG
jgi:hypothetical protein